MTGGQSVRRGRVGVWVRWLAVLAWMGFIFGLSSQSSLPSAPEPLLELAIKKGGHMVIFGILALLWWQALVTIPPLRAHALWLALTLTVTYAMSDEWHQRFVSGRDGNIRDVVIDSVGAMLAMYGRGRWLVHWPVIGPLLR